MDKETETKITRWVDGDMNAEECAAFEAELAANSALREEAEAVGRLREALRRELSSPIDPPYPDFFNHQILKRIRDEESAVAAASAAPAAAGGAFAWLRLPWLVAAAACVAAVIAFVTTPDQSAPVQVASVGAVYAPDPNVKADVRFDAVAGATVIVLEGLEEIPADRDVKPYDVAEYDLPDAADGMTIFRGLRGDDPAPLFVMHHPGSGAPMIHALR